MVRSWGKLLDQNTLVIVRSIISTSIKGFALIGSREPICAERQYRRIRNGGGHDEDENIRCQQPGRAGKGEVNHD
ncbi:MAG: hypothetical protein ACE14P_06295 [Methanotrichaceae archaeon]